jgi:alpha-1,6-mannosyl-glycoprotein beta-1,2-N-acetylglucosaminyltransferase
MKHHWWWKLNQIFDRLSVTKNHNGYLLLLEEDHFVAEDFIHVLTLMKGRIIKDCAKCNVISLGTYSESMNEGTFDTVEFHPWITNQHNMGFAFNKSSWNAIKRCAKYFCGYDEYNYDFSLQNVNQECLESKLITAMIRGPRVFHTGECSGVHHHEKVQCDADDIVNEIKVKLKTAKEENLLFPTALQPGADFSSRPQDELTPNGGWGDPRDQNLCMSMTL